jgi:hypothetical protein
MDDLPPRGSVGRFNAKTRRACLRTGFERSNSLWTMHHGSLDQSNEKRICFAQVEKFFPASKNGTTLSQINDICLLIASQRVARMRGR